MATIDIENVTNSDETGIFDKLMQSINNNIEKQYLNNRITGSDYATVYLSSLQSALSQSIQFSLQEDIVEAQIAGIEADNALKADQLLTSTVDRSIKTFELTNILPRQVDKLVKDIDVAERAMVEQETTGVRQRLLLDTEEQIKQYEFDFLLPEQLIKIQEEIDILQTQDAELQLDGVKKRLIMDEEIENANLQQIILATEEELKTAQKDEILASTTRASTQLSDSLLTTAKQRVLLDEEKETADKQQLLVDEQIKVAYTDRVLKDKQAAKLGMDNVMKIAETARTADPAFIYVPTYQGV